jgi:sulfide:quinone oxidoreductase
MNEGLTRVLIAGAGVAGLEAMLALHERASDRVDVTLLSPESEFRYRQLSVASPFGLAEPVGFNLDEITRELGVHHRRATLRDVDVEARTVRTTAGTEIEYDELLLALGAQPVNAVPGALTFRGFQDVASYRKILERLERGEIRRLVFAVPDGAWWPLALYELALLTAAHVAAAELADVELSVVSPEPGPLDLFGSRASAAVAELLAKAGVAFAGNRTPIGFDGDQLDASRGSSVPCDCAVSLPVPVVDEIPGVPQQPPHGYIPTDAFGRVMGIDHIYAAGDATAFPVKQGGLAAQQADAAASSIAEVAGSDAPAEPFRPVLRGALLTTWGPRYLRSDLADDSVAARSTLWWPPGKVAGRLLAPYLARKAGDPAAPLAKFADLQAPPRDDPTDVDTGHEDALALALASADVDAEEREFGRAVHWLEVAEDLELHLPPAYEAKRVAWRELAHRASPGRPTTGRS